MIQTCEDTLAGREIPNKTTDRKRLGLDQGGCSQDFLGLGGLGLFQDIDDAQIVLPAQILLANTAQVGDGPFGPGIAPGHK